MQKLTQYNGILFLKNITSLAEHDKNCLVTNNKIKQFKGAHKIKYLSITYLPLMQM